MSGGGHVYLDKITMARAYRLGLWRRLINWMIGVLLRFGVSPPHTYLLTVRGRKSGHPYSTPVTLVQEAGERCWWPHYGEVGWVRNARAAEHVTLTRGRRFENVRNSGTLGGRRRTGAKEVSDSSACGTAVL
jgi:hypothetical protein